MFMVINKDKIISYFISFSTVAILFCFSFFMTKNNENILETSTNIPNNRIMTNAEDANSIEINKIKTEKNQMY